jgi:hypothetical protein
VRPCWNVVTSLIPRTDIRRWIASWFMPIVFPL